MLRLRSGSTASDSGVVVARGDFCFCDGGSLALQIAATAARSSGGARATDAISEAVGLTSPEALPCARNGFFSGVYTLENCSARRTVFLLMPFSAAIFLSS